MKSNQKGFRGNQKTRITTMDNQPDREVHPTSDVDHYIEGPNASSTQGLDKYYTTKEPPEVGFKRIFFIWALGVLTVLIFIPVAIPGIAWYCITVQGSLLGLAAGIMGIKYLQRSEGGGLPAAQG
jgi:hypothetical protein